VGAREQRQRNFEPERAFDREVDDQFETIRQDRIFSECANEVAAVLK
jgi:hypothetical protein